MPDFSAEKFIKELDAFFAREDLTGAGEYLRAVYAETDKAGDDRGKLTVLNEMIGFFRQTAEEEAALDAISEAFELIEKTGIAGEISGATIYLNCATTLKCFGRSAEAMQYYEKTQSVYDKKLDRNHPLVAGLYNNKALALQDLGEIEESEKCFRKAIEITLTDSANAL
ncbi:MAG: tetratricopeptide repeat protein, partial [Clostridia bacterium]|nr:tetratricopeptide repeat protein [Clostridia bacterium]